MLHQYGEVFLRHALMNLAILGGSQKVRVRREGGGGGGGGREEEERERAYASRMGSYMPRCERVAGRKGGSGSEGEGGGGGCSGGSRGGSMEPLF